MTTNIQYSGGQYAQGLVLAEMQKLSPELAEFLNQQTKTLVSMSKAALHSTVSAAGNAMTSAIAQSGISLAGAAAGGATAYSGFGSMTKTIAEDSTFERQLGDVEKDIRVAKSPELEFKDEDEFDPHNNDLGNGQEGIQLRVRNDNNAPSTPKDLKELEMKRENLINKHKQTRKDIGKGHENSSSVANALRSVGETAGQPVNGLGQKQQQEQQGLQNIQNQASQQAESAKEQVVSTWTSLVQAVGEVQGYTSAMAR